MTGRLIIVLLLLAAAVHADINTADALLADGKNREAVELYTEWLENNSASDNIFSILFRAVKASEDTDTGIKLLVRFIPSIRKAEQKRTALALLGSYYELSGDIADAQKAYERSADIDGIGTDYSLLLKSAVLLQYMGEYKRSELQILRALHKSDNSRTEDACYLLLARLYTLTGDVESCREVRKELSKSGNDDVLYFLNKTVDSEDKPSPEYLLQKGKISLLPDIENAFGLLNGRFGGLSDGESGKEIGSKDVSSASKTDDNVFFIQTGSFRDMDNAEYMSRDLSALGFKTRISDQIINGKTYHKVYIEAADVNDVPELILKLKDAGYEGYPVY